MASLAANLPDEATEKLRAEALRGKKVLILSAAKMVSSDITDVSGMLSRPVNRRARDRPDKRSRCGACLHQVIDVVYPAALIHRETVKSMILPRLTLIVENILSLS